MDKILEDIRVMVEKGDSDDILEFAEILMTQNKSLIECNDKLNAKCEFLVKRMQPEPEPEPESHPVFEPLERNSSRGTEKIEYTEGLSPTGEENPNLIYSD